jgi:hypothetical protein
MRLKLPRNAGLAMFMPENSDLASRFESLSWSCIEGFYVRFPENLSQRIRLHVLDSIPSL